MANLVVLHRSQDGRSFEVWEDPYNLGVFGKIRGFRIYERARAFAEKEALDKNLELQDNVAFAESAFDPFDHTDSMSAEERLMRAIFGEG